MQAHSGRPGGTPETRTPLRLSTAPAIPAAAASLALAAQSQQAPARRQAAFNAQRLFLRL
jgi:hypothetical protein